MEVSPTVASTLTVRILVVDDEEKLARFVCVLLKQMGYQATPCRNVEEARRLLLSGPWNLVITDLVIPYENGFDLMRWVQSHYPTLPVVAMTAHSTEAVSHQINRFGFAAILHKPFSIENFQQVIQRIGPTFLPLH